MVTRHLHCNSVYILAYLMQCQPKILSLKNNDEHHRHLYTGVQLLPPPLRRQI